VCILTVAQINFVKPPITSCIEYFTADVTTSSQMECFEYNVGPHISTEFACCHCLCIKKITFRITNFHKMKLRLICADKRIAEDASRPALRCYPRTRRLQIFDIDQCTKCNGRTRVRTSEIAN
jgi:hypothetical protein